MRFQLEGIIPAMLTPFTKGGKHVDYDKACALAKHLKKKGVHGVFVAGTTGEGPLMTVEERKRLLEEIVATVGKSIKVIAHTGSLDTPTAIELSRHARQAGAHAAAVVAPSFWRYDEAALAAHYKAIARSVKDFPVMLYNLPGCTNNPLTPKLVLDLANKVDNIVGMKDSSGNMPALNMVLADRPKDFKVISGTDEYAFQSFATGADGAVSSTANVVPEMFLAIYNHVRGKRRVPAWNKQKELIRACGLFQYGAMVAYYKEGLRMRGFDAGYVRPPQRELTKDEIKGLAKGLKAAGLI
jgi:4-hydroxy-tetrahydrodipicolinate synthase